MKTYNIKNKTFRVIQLNDNEFIIQRKFKYPLSFFLPNKLKYYWCSQLFIDNKFISTNKYTLYPTLHKAKLCLKNYQVYPIIH